MEALEFRFAFHARDFDRSVGFYRDTLGMHDLGGWDRADGKGALLSAGGTAVIEIYGAARDTFYQGPAPVAVNLALRLPNAAEVDHEYARLVAAGAAIAGPPENHVWGHRTFIIYDPDGIPIHFYAEIALA